MRKITIGTFIMVILNLSLLAQTEEKKRISINRPTIKVGELLNEISEQSGVDFSFNPLLINNEESISFRVENATIEQAVQQLCKKLFIDHTFVEGQVVLVNLPEDKLPSYTFSGFLSDSSSGEDLISATVSVDDNSYGGYTNEFGYFAISLKRGKHKVIFSYVGFKEKTVELDIKSNVEENISLPKRSADLPTVIIKPRVMGVMDEKSLGELSLSNSFLSSLPELGSESDLVKGLETLPGVKRHSDLSSFFYVRGGDRDQNVIIIDDAPIYSPSHFLGISSMVIPDFTKSITIYKSDVPTSMGDRLASIVSIRTKDGNLNSFKMSAALNPLVNRVSVEIPVIKERSSIFASFRRSAFELLNRNATPENNFFFQDLHIKWNYKPNQKNRFFITAIFSGDDYAGQIGELSSIKSGNFAATLRWNRTFGPKLFSNTTLYTGNYSFVSSFVPNTWQSELGTLSLKSDFSHFASKTYSAKFGIEAQGYFTTPGRISLDSTNSLLPDISRNYSRKLVLYYHGQFDLHKKLRINAGFRLINWDNTGPMTYYTYTDQYEVAETIEAPEGVYNSYFNIDPRLSLQYKLTDDAQLKLSYGIYHQYLQLISNSISPFTAMEIWLTASPNIKPQEATQYSLDFIQRLNKSKMELRASGYYKKSKHQIDFNGHGTTYLNQFLEGELRFGTAESYGLEIGLNKKFGRLNTSLAYTYSRVFKETKDINDNKSYRAFQDRPHDLALNFNFEFSRRFSCSAYWTSYSGSPYTAPIGFYTFNEKKVPIYGERNNERLPTYHRLDVSCHYKLNKRETTRFQHSLTFSIYNALGQRNIYGVKFNKLYSDELYPDVPVNVLSIERTSPSQLELVQFFPSLTYKFSL